MTPLNAELPVRALRFAGLMPHRVREVLLVSSPFDAFILEEDGLLTEQLFREWADISRLSPPRFTHAPDGRSALKLLQRRRFDLVLTMTSLPDMAASDLARKVKRARPGRPVVLLSLDRRELKEMKTEIEAASFDGVFLWSGDATILLAIIKNIEDRENVDHDVRHGGVRVILMLEDSPRHYSSFLGMLYKELMLQSTSLYTEGVNEHHRQMYMRSRPKVLHATSYEAGMELYRRYKKNLMAVICDIEIPRKGEIDHRAGLAFARVVRRYDPDMPILIQSSEGTNESEAEKLGLLFENKNSPQLLARIRDFLNHELGFGDFLFRTPEGDVIERARDLRELERKVATVPEASLVYHAAHNHFSVWLGARSEFGLAERIRPQRRSDFTSVEAMRQHLLHLLREARLHTRLGVVSDFQRQDFDQYPFVRLGRGALGGKARGMAFLHRELAKAIDLPTAADGLSVSVPKTVVVTTEHFDAFIELNGLREWAIAAEDDQEIARRFLAARLPPDLEDDLGFLIGHLDYPLAVRSSSLLEDSMHQPLAGVYATLMIANNADDAALRARQLGDAIKLVYASTFFRNARAYLDGTGHLPEEEKMAIIIQQLVGQARGDRFYPTFAGVAQSYNYYPIGPQKAEEGVVHLALGLGRLVVDGGLALRFSPSHPEVLPQFATPQSMLKSSQRGFYALDLAHGREATGEALFRSVQYYELEEAEVDGTLAIAGSVYSRDDQRIRDDLRLAGPRVVTFANVIKHKAIPLADTLVRLLEVGTRGFGGPVEIEFAGDIGDWGRRRRRGRRRPPHLFPLQIRSFGHFRASKEPSQVHFAREDSLAVSLSSLGHGVFDSIHDIVFVVPDRWDPARNKAIAKEVEQLNADLRETERDYVLIGPGRWGTADPWLGIPVEWNQISRVRVIVEASPSGFDVEPSQGTHFFQNITSQQIGYLTLPPGTDTIDPKSGEFLDWTWLLAQPAAEETEHLRLVRLDAPLTVVLDGWHRRGTIAQPGAEPIEACTVGNPTPVSNSLVRSNGGGG